MKTDETTPKGFNDLDITDFESGLLPEHAKEALKRCGAYKVLVEALEEAQHYILTRKGKEFHIQNNDYYHISVVMNEAVKLAKS